MKHIVLINASPHKEWNTGTLIREAARGAEARIFDLYTLEKFTGCISCFGCKLPANKGKCIYQDGLAPKYPFPIAPKDCYAAYLWVIAHAGELSIDPARVVVAGDSIGGQLATVVCLMAKDRGQAIPCGQMLIYPAAGNVETESVRKYTDTPMCNSRDMEKYRKLYRPDSSIGNNIYVSPIETESLEGLPTLTV